MKVVISLGSNLGNREANLSGSIKSLAKFINVEQVSEFIETEPVGGPEQPNYINAVLIGESNLSPEELLKSCQEIEAEFGRIRDVRWGPRTLDIDLIKFGETQMNSEKLTLPHPRAHEREFVLEPWLSIEPNAELAGKGLVADLLAALK